VCQRNKILDREVEERNVFTAAVFAICAINGAVILWVYDMERNVQAVRVAEAIIGREDERVQRRDDQRVNISFPIGPRLARRT
jgi:dihydropteroate synthase